MKIGFCYHHRINVVDIPSIETSGPQTIIVVVSLSIACLSPEAVATMIILSTVTRALFPLMLVNVLIAAAIACLPLTTHNS